MQKNISPWLPWIPLGGWHFRRPCVEDGLFRPVPDAIGGVEDLVVDLFPTHDYAREAAVGAASRR